MWIHIAAAVLYELTKPTWCLTVALDQLIAVKVPAITRQEVWEGAQERRRHNKHISGTKLYLSRGLVTCACGRKMRGGTCYRANHLLYRCNSEQTYFAELEAKKRTVTKSPLMVKRLSL
jgi:hypothetical protein